MKRTILFCFILLTGYISKAQLADSLCNSSFEDSLTNWSYFANAGAAATFDVSNTQTQDGALSANVDVTVLPGTVIMSSCLGDMEADKKYRISFWAKTAAGNLDLKVTSSKATSPFTDYGVLNATIDNTWKYYSFFSYSATANTGDVKLAKFKFLTAGEYFIDNVLIEKFDVFTEICDGNIEGGVANWGKTTSAPSSQIIDELSDVFQGQKSARVDAPDLSSGNVILSSCKSDVEIDVKYRIKFWAKTTVGTQDVKATSSLGSAPWTDFGSLNATLNTTWSEYSFITTSDSTIKGNVSLFKIKPLTTGTFLIDSVTFEIVPPSAEICDANFEGGVAGWGKTVTAPSSQIIDETTDVHQGLKSARIEAPDLSSGQVILSSCKSDLISGNKYKVKFWAKAVSGTVDIETSASLGSAPYTIFGSTTTTLNTTWTQYEYEVSNDSTIQGNVSLFKLKPLTIGTILVDSITIEILPPTASICNKGIENGLNDWITSINPSATAQIVSSTTEKYSGSSSVKVEVLTPGTAPSHIQLSSCKSDMNSGETYTVSFWAKTNTGTVDIKALSSLADAPYTTYGTADFTITDSWNEYCYNVTADTTIIGNVRWLKLNFPNQGTVFIDDADVVDSVKTCNLSNSINDKILTDLKIYPNPASSRINLNMNLAKIEQICISDLTGKTISNYLVNNKSTSVDISSLNTGIYIVKVKTLNGLTLIKKLVKE